MGGDRGVRISRLPYPYLPPPVPLSPASRTLISRLSYLFALHLPPPSPEIYYITIQPDVFFQLLSITQTKDKSRRVNQRRIFAGAFVSFVYFDAICKSNNMIMLKSLFIIFFIQPFINVVSLFPSPEDSRLPLFPLPPSVTFLPGYRPPCLSPQSSW